MKKGYQVVIVGAGPSAIFAAFILSGAGVNAIFERGKNIDERKRGRGMELLCGWGTRSRTYVHFGKPVEFSEELIQQKNSFYNPFIKAYRLIKISRRGKINQEPAHQSHQTTGHIR